MKILICGVHPPVGYSGGRYHAWMMGEALSAAGHDVTLWTNVIPVYASDFENFPGHTAIKLCIDKRFNRQPGKDFDWVVIVPDMSSTRAVYAKWLCCAYNSTARIALLNFESANFFNAFAPVPRNPKLWQSWRTVSQYCDVIMSSAEISNQYASKFYTDAPESCSFVTCQPSINSVEAHLAKPVADARRIFVITRFGTSDSGHKGGEEFLSTLGREIEGCTVCLLVGKNGVPDHVKEILDERSRECGFQYEILRELNDRAKFSYLKSAKLMVFLSRFEGFGYPPVEAVSCGIPCIASNLEILRETSGGALLYVDPTSVSEVKSAVGKVLRGEWVANNDDEERVRRLVSFDSYTQRLSKIFSTEPSGEMPILKFNQALAKIKIIIWACLYGVRWIYGKMRSAIRHSKRGVLRVLDPKRKFE